MSMLDSLLDGIVPIPLCQAAYTFPADTGGFTSLRCDLRAGHGDEPGPGDQDLHYDLAKDLYWFPNHTT